MYFRSPAIKTLLTWKVKMKRGRCEEPQGDGDPLLLCWSAGEEFPTFCHYDLAVVLNREIGDRTPQFHSLPVCFTTIASKKRLGQWLGGAHGYVVGMGDTYGCREPPICLTSPAGCSPPLKAIYFMVDYTCDRAPLFWVVWSSSKCITAQVLPSFGGWSTGVLWNLYYICSVHTVDMQFKALDGLGTVLLKTASVTCEPSKHGNHQLILLVSISISSISVSMMEIPIQGVSWTINICQPCFCLLWVSLGRCSFTSGPNHKIFFCPNTTLAICLHYRVNIWHNQKRG